MRNTPSDEMIKKWLKGKEPVSRSDLEYLIHYDFDIRFINTSEITNMSYLFQNKVWFNQDISRWAVSNVTDMEGMFSYSKKFNQDISKWDVSNVKNMSFMFACAEEFNKPLNDWNISNIKTIESMFFKAIKFNQPLDKWNVSNIDDMRGLFSEAIKFNQDLSTWNVTTKKVASFLANTSEFNNYLPLSILEQMTYVFVDNFRIKSKNILKKSKKLNKIKLNKDLCELNYMDSTETTWYNKLSKYIKEDYFFVYELKNQYFIFIDNNLNCFYFDEKIAENLKQK